MLTKLLAIVVHGLYLNREMCGRLNRSGPITSQAVRGSGGASVVIEGSVFASHAAAGKPCNR